MPIPRNKKIENLKRLISEHSKYIESHISEIRRKYIFIEDPKLRKIAEILEKNIKNKRDLLNDIPLKVKSMQLEINELDNKIKHTKIKMELLKQNMESKSNINVEKKIKETIELQRKIETIEQEIKKRNNEITNKNKRKQQLLENNKIILKQLEIKKRTKEIKKKIDQILSKLNTNFKATNLELISKLKKIDRNNNKITINLIHRTLLEYLLPYGIGIPKINEIKSSIKKNNYDIIRNLEITSKEVQNISINNMKFSKRHNIYSDKYKQILENLIKPNTKIFYTYIKEYDNLKAQSSKIDSNKKLQISGFSTEELINKSKKINKEVDILDKDIEKIKKENSELENQNKKTQLEFNKISDEIEKNYRKQKLENKSKTDIKERYDYYNKMYKKMVEQRNKIKNKMKISDTEYQELLYKARLLAEIDQKLYNNYK